MNLPGAVSSARLPERVRSLVTTVNLHYTGVGLLLLANLYLALQLGLAGRTASNSGADALAEQGIALKTADLQARPLQGLDTKLTIATTESDEFYGRRLPSSFSQILSELGALVKKEPGVKLGRGQYNVTPVLPNTPGELTEVRIDAALTGDYRPLMLLINALERDRMFFLISNIALTGQQSGTVGLRIRITTYIRPGALPAGLPPTGDVQGDDRGVTATPASVPSGDALGPQGTVPATARTGSNSTGGLRR